MSYFSQSYSKSNDLTSAKGNRPQILHFVDAGEHGCDVTDLLPIRNTSILLNPDVQTVDTDQKRKVALLDRKKERLLCFKDTESQMSRSHHLHFPLEKWLSSFVFHRPLLPLFMGRKRKT